jgi:hypothetical protein
MTSLPNTGDKKNTFTPLRIEAEQMMMRTVDQSDIEYQCGNVRRNIPLKGKRSLNDLDIRNRCREIVEENFEPQLQLQCSREWFKRNPKNPKATFKHRLDYKSRSLQSGHLIIDEEVQQARQRELCAIMEEFPAEKIYNFDESRSFSKNTLIRFHFIQMLHFIQMPDFIHFIKSFFPSECLFSFRSFFTQI